MRRELSQTSAIGTHLDMRRTHNRAQRFGGHTKHTFYCSCGKTVAGNGGKRHFELDGHKRILQHQWFEKYGGAAHDPFKGSGIQPHHRKDFYREDGAA